MVLSIEHCVLKDSWAGVPIGKLEDLWASVPIGTVCEDPWACVSIGTTTLW